MVSIKEIAQKSGVSMMTVSNVLNGKTNKVSETTYNMVMDIINELNYIPNATARSLSSKKSKIIALWLPSYYNNALLETPYISYITGTISRFVYKNDYNLMLLSQSSVENFVNVLKSWNVDGCIGIAINSEDVDFLTNHLNKPIVYVDTYSDLTDVFTILTDDYNGGLKATQHLIDMGHKNIAIVTGQEIYDNELLKKNGVLYNRYLGYSTALTESGLTIKTDFLIGEEISFEGGYQIGLSIAETNQSNITGIFCTSDEMAIGIKEGLMTKGKMVPEDISLVGFDDLPMSSYVTPKLTTIRQQNKNKGLMSVELLVNLLHEKKVENHNTLFEIELIERESVKKISMHI